VDRQLIATHVGKVAALALTQETIAATFDNGPATYSLDRYVVWGLTRQTGAWQIFQIFTEFPIPPDR
jgi:hypothetical protein